MPTALKAPRRRQSARSALPIALLTAVLLPGCKAPVRSVAEVFPYARMADPWALARPVWQGDFEAAHESLGEDAELLRPYQPVRVWLAEYQHARRPDARLIVRACAFDAPEAAAAACRALCPPLGDALRAGDGGCWTDFGAAFSTGRLVFDVFIRDPDAGASSMQAAMFVGILENRLTDELRSAPR